MSEHTKGPWDITSISMDTGDVGVGSREGRFLIASVTNAASFGDMVAGAMKRGGGQLRQEDASTQFANARLIAAAPDLLEALDRAQRFLDTPEVYSQWPVGELRILISDALAKATS
jgi:hypothetical protein